MTFNNSLIKFNELKCLADDKLNELNEARVHEICTVELNIGSNIIEIFDFYLNKYYENRLRYSDDLRKSLTLDVAIPEVEKFCKNILSFCNSNKACKEEIVEKLDQLNEIVRICVNLQRIVNEHLKGINILVLLCISINSLKIVSGYYQYYIERLKSKDQITETFLQIAKTVYAQCKNLQNLVTFSLVAEETKYFNSKDNSRNNDAFIELITHLCKIGELVTLLDVKLTADTWKCIMKLSSDNEESLKCNFSNTFDSMRWMARSVEFLNVEIIKGISDISKDTYENEEKIVRCLKINGFYMKILMKFSSLFDGRYFVGYEFIIKSYIELQRIEKTVNFTNSLEKINQYITSGYTTILEECLQNQYFPEVLFKTIQTILKPFKFLQFLLISIEILLNRKDYESLSMYLVTDQTNYNLLEVIFQTIPLCRAELKKFDFYSYLIRQLSMLVIKNIPNKTNFITIEETLMKFTLYSDLTEQLQTIIFDVWKIYLKTQPPECAFHYFNFFNEINQKYPNCYNFPESVSIKHLLKLSYDSLPANFQNRVLAEHMPQVNVKLWGTLGLNRIQDRLDRNEIRGEFISIFVNKSSEYINSTTKTVDEYYKIIEYLTLLRKFDRHPRVNDFMNALRELWRDLPIHIEQITSLVIVMLKVTANISRLLTSADTLVILSKIIEILSTWKTIEFTLTVIRFLETVVCYNGGQDEIRLIIDIYKTILQNPDPLIKRTCYSSLIRIEDFLPPEDNDLVVESIVYVMKNRQLQEERVIKHICPLKRSYQDLIDDKEHENPNKKIKTEESTAASLLNSDDIKNTISRLLIDTNFITKQFNQNRLTSSDLNNVQNIVNLLNKVK